MWMLLIYIIRIGMKSGWMFDRLVRFDLGVCGIWGLEINGDVLYIDQLVDWWGYPVLSLGLLIWGRLG